MPTLQGQVTHTEYRPSPESGGGFDFGSLIPLIPGFGTPNTGLSPKALNEFLNAPPVSPFSIVPPVAAPSPSTGLFPMKPMDFYEPPRRLKPRPGEQEEEVFGDPVTQTIANPEQAAGGSKLVWWLILAGTGYAAYHYSKKGG